LSGVVPLPSTGAVPLSVPLFSPVPFVSAAVPFPVALSEGAPPDTGGTVDDALLLP